MFYRLYDLQTGCYMATGYNTTSLADLAVAYLEYDGMGDYTLPITTEKILDRILGNEFIVENSLVPFAPYEDDTDDSSISVIRRKSDSKLFTCYFRDGLVKNYKTTEVGHWFTEVGGDEEICINGVDEEIYDVIEVVNI